MLRIIKALALACIAWQLAFGAVTGLLYGKLTLALANKEHDFSADTLKVLLTTSSYSPNQDTHDYLDDITNEVVGTGYSAGGATLANKTETYTGATNTYMLDADDVSWASSTITARYGVVYNATGGGTDASRGLIGYQNFGGDQSTSGTTFTIQWAAAGIVNMVVA